jgi:hypothetical protein
MSGEEATLVRLLSSGTEDKDCRWSAGSVWIRLTIHRSRADRRTWGRPLASGWRVRPGVYSTGEMGGQLNGNAGMSSWAKPWIGDVGVDCMKRKG